MQAAMRALKSPIPVALFFAILFRATGLATPTIVARPIELLSDAAIPPILVLLGAQVARAERISHLKLIAGAVMLRLLVGPLVGFGLAAVLALSGGARTAFILQASMPTAVMTIILATEYHLNTELMSNIILISLLLSPLTLTPLILYFQ
jgi:predicted permease